ncbi:MAG: hypothetical protein RR840_09665 [Clostridium sp.]
MFSNGINHRGEKLTLLVVGFSILMNLSGFFIDNLDLLRMFSIANEAIPSILVILLVLSFYDTFMDNAFYVYMLPISKKRIAGGIILKWTLAYITYLVVYVGSVFMKDDFTLLINNIDIKGELFKIIINYIRYPMLGLAVVSAMVISKARKIHSLFFILGIYIVGKASFYLPHKTYSFTYKIDMWRLWEERKIHLLANQTPNGNNIAVSPIGESVIYYGGYKIYLITLIGLLIWAGLSIERLSMENNIKSSKKRRLLNERKWYNKSSW